jgi:hypothetical protein
MSFGQAIDMRRPTLRIVEWTAVGLAAVWLARFAHVNGGIVLGSDMPYYIDIGLRGVADPFILYRYSHVYALRVFSLIAGSSLAGVRLYSGIAAGITVVLTYITARSFTRGSSPLNGLTASLLLLGLPLTVNLLLAPHVDTTVTLVMLAFVALYVLFSRSPNPRRWLLAAMGLVFFAAIRSKEVALVLATLVPGLGVANGEKFAWPTFRRHMRYFLIGIAGGVMLFIVANQIFLGSPLFGLRPADFIAHLDLWSNTVRSLNRPASTVAELLSEGGGAVFVLYAAAGVWSTKRLPVSLRMLWLLPLSLVAFLLLGSTRTLWTIVPRGFLAGMAVMSVLASQIFVLRLPMSRKSLRITIIAMTAALPLVIYGLASGDEVSLSASLESMLVPIGVGLILALIYIVQDRDVLGLPVFLSVFLLALVSAGLNIRTTTSDLNQSSWDSRFSIPLSFRDQIGLRPLKSMFVADNVIPSLSIQRNRDELAVSINTALDLQTIRTDFSIGSVDDTFVERLENGDFSHVLIRSTEWDWLRTDPQDRPEWRDRYRAFEEPTGSFIMLVLKDDANSG